MYKEKHKKVIKKQFEISALTWDEELALPGGSYSVSDIQDHFECIFKKNMKERLISLQ